MDIAGVADSCVVHTAEVNCLGFNPFNEYVLATGSADKTVSHHYSKDNIIAISKAFLYCCLCHTSSTCLTLIALIKA